MIIDDIECICGNCIQDGYCKIQKDIGHLQMVAYVMKPDDVMIKIQTKECPRFKPKEVK